ncbi:MAG TPA: nuclear transport factor 2 family protein [Gammaproteobacteria bacterium]
MASTLARAFVLFICVAAAALRPALAQPKDAGLDARLDRLEAEIQSAENLSAVKRLQRIYGYYVDKGMWADVAELFADDAVANYPAGVFIGKESIRRHLFMNVGGGEMGEVGLGYGRLYDHLNIQPVVHLDPGGETAHGRWRALAMFGHFGGGATWAEGVYNMTYVKEDGVWKIRTLDYYAGFGAPYETGWVVPEQPRESRARRNLAHPPDRERNMPCEGFPEACIAPFHYENLGTGSNVVAWTTGAAAAESAVRASVEARAADLARRARRLADEQEIENLIEIYGYYRDRRSWDQVADLFADDGTIEMGLRGVYVGKERIRAFLDLLGPAGLEDGVLNDHVQLQPVVTVAPDGRTAKARSRELAMTGVYEGRGWWSAGVYENTFVKEDGVWKIQSLHFYPTFITDYGLGWAKDAQPAPGVSAELPPDRPPTDVYAIYPNAHIPPYHYLNPVTGEPPVYPPGAGRPSAPIDAVFPPVGSRSGAAADAAAGAAADTAAASAADAASGEAADAAADSAADVSAFRDADASAVTDADASAVAGADAAGGAADVLALVSEAERLVARVKDYHELDNLENAYGYYLDKNLWNDLADLFAEEGSMELAQRGVYRGRERVRGFLFAAFGAEGPVEGRLGNHIQMQHVIHVAPDGRSAKIRARMLQQLNFGGRPSLGAAVYENEAVKEDGVWKFSKVHAFNTWTASYDGGWAHSPGRRLPGPSENYPPDGPPTFVFEMFPNVYELPFHYANPVTGRPPALSTSDLAPAE